MPENSRRPLFCLPHHKNTIFLTFTHYKTQPHDLVMFSVGYFIKAMLIFPCLSSTVLNDLYG